jgi:hypothetical protein
VSINVMIVDGPVRSTTPLFLGADPASSPLLGGALLRPLGGIEDAARSLVASLDPPLHARAVVHPRAPSDIVGGNRPIIAAGDDMLLITEVWRAASTSVETRRILAAASRAIEAATGYGPADHRVLGLPEAPSGAYGREPPGTATTRTPSGAIPRVTSGADEA